MRYEYELANGDHIPEKLLDEAKDALEKRVYVCQQEFENLLDMYHEINLFALPETTGEARVIRIEIENGVCCVTLDLAPIKYYPPVVS